MQSRVAQYRRAALPKGGAALFIQARRSVADSEAAPAMRRLLQLVDQGDRVILCGNRAVALGVDQKLVGAKAEFSGALARLDQGGRREEGPVEALLQLQQAEEG